MPNFNPKTIKIESLLVWVGFSVLPVEYYTSKWLERDGNVIGRTIEVDMTTLLASSGKSSRVCIELDLTKPLKAGHTMRADLQEVQYKGLYELCFQCGK